jgi:hypothetical protein
MKKISIDWLAVIGAVALTVLVWAGTLPHIPW